MRTFTVDGVMYHGFDRHITSASHIAIVVWEGETNVFALDEPANITEVQKYHRDMGGYWFLVGVFTRGG